MKLHSLLTPLLGSALMLCTPIALTQSNTFSGTVVKLPDPVVNPAGTILTPNAIAVDAVGNVFVADCIGTGTTTNNTTSLWELPATSTAAVELTTGLPFCVMSMAIDPNRNLYLSSGSALYELTVASNYGGNPPPLTINAPSPGFSSRGRLAMDGRGNLFVADDTQQTITEFTSNNGVLQSSASAQWTSTASFPLNRSIELASDAAGDLYVLDGSSSVREIVATNGVLTTASRVVPVGGGFGQSLAITVDIKGNVFVTARGPNLNHFLLEFPSTGTNTFGPITYVADGAFDRSLVNSNALATDAAGDVYVADSGQARTLEFNPKSPVDFGTQTLNGGETAKSLSFMYFGDFNHPLGTISISTLVNGKATPSLDFFDAGTGTCRANLAGNILSGNTCTLDLIFKPSTIGTVGGMVTVNSSVTGPALLSAALTGQGVPAESTVGGGFDHPEGLAVDAHDAIYVADTLNRRLASVGVGGSATVVPQVVSFGSFAVDSTGNIFFCRSPQQRRAGTASRRHGTGQCRVRLVWARGVAIDSTNNLYVADSNNGAVKKMTISSSGIYGTPVVIMGTPTVYYPTGVAVDNKTKDVYVADPPTNRVVRLPNGGAPMPIGTSFNGPYGVAVDSYSNLFVADSGNDAIEEISPANFNLAQTIWTRKGSHPMAVVVDSQETVYLTDTNNSRVEKLVINVALPVK